MTDSVKTREPASKHTRAPWYTNGHEIWSKDQAHVDGVAYVLHVNDPDEVGLREQSVADAHLISAAPELLESLEECMALLEDRAALLREGLDGIADIAVEEARAIIAKARGGTGSAKTTPRRDKRDARLLRIAEIIEAVDDRCMAVDGPVTPTLKEMTQGEISEIYRLAGGEVQL